jgi:ABC transport system ATP-binding/permease protein
VTVNLVNLESVAKVYGTRQVFQAVSLGIGRGDRVGVVGRNGDGKSTLLRLISRAEQPDSGRVAHVGGLRVGRLGQHDDLDPAQTVRETVV